MYSGLKEYFQVLGYEIETVPEVGLSGSEDKKIAEYAKKHNMILVTEDRKPAELADLLGARYYYVDMKTKAKMIEAKLIEKFPELKPETRF
jgi:predicted nuclease of predicted toxin-antitoxin system